MSTTSASTDPVDKHIINKSKNVASDADSKPAKSKQMDAELQEASASPAVQTNIAAAESLELAGVPVGVQVVEDGLGANRELTRLLRQPRYFDENFVPGAAITCWKCGRRGHLSRDCTYISQKPCVLCAQYGHESTNCPYRK